MEVVAAAGNATAHKFAVVLEVHGVEGDIALGRAQIADTVDHVLALLRGGHQLRGGFVAHGHIVEVEAKVGTLVAQEPHEGVVGNSLNVLAGVADRGAKEDAVFLQQIHGMHHSGVVALTPACIVGLRGALDGQHKGDVAQTLHFLAEGLVDEGGVGVDGKLHVVVLFGQLQDVLLAHQRLAAGEHIQVHAQLLALGDDLVHVLKAQVVLVAVLAGPAAHAVHIAGGGRVKQDQPRDVALVFDTVFPDGLGAPEKSLVAQVQGSSTGHMGVGLVQHAVDELGPLAVGVRQDILGLLVGFLAEGVAVELLRQVHYLADGLFPVIFHVREQHVHHLTDGSTLHFMGQTCKRSIHNFSSKLVLWIILFSRRYGITAPFPRP